MTRDARFIAIHLLARWCTFCKQFSFSIFILDHRGGGRGSGLECGSRDLGSIPGIPSLCMDPLMARRLTINILGCPGRVRVGSALKKNPSCPWYGVKLGNWTTVLSLYGWNIAEFDDKPQEQTNKSPSATKILFVDWILFLLIHCNLDKY